MSRYRVVTDEWAGYSIQVKYWYWPFWFFVPRGSFETVARAKKAIHTLRGAGKVVAEHLV